MRDEEAVVSGRRSGFVWDTLTTAEKLRIARYVFGTILGVLLFTGALSVSGYVQFSTRMPGYIVLYWFPALMAGRALAGYRGSGLIVSSVGGSFTGMFHPTVDSSTIGYMLAGLAVEGLMILASQDPAAWMCIIIGMAASLGKLVPKVAIIFTAGTTPHHSSATLPFMLRSYLLFGGLAGLIYVAGRYTARKAQARISPEQKRSDSGFASVALILLVAAVGMLAALYA
jgi:hypothetical protein